MSVRQDRPFDVQPQANGAMATAAERATQVGLLLAALAVLVPGDVGRGLGIAAVAVVVVAPLARVAWLAARWVRRGDRRFALAAAVLLAVVATGGVLALLTRG